MNKEVCAFLDCARLFYAILVLLAHVELNWVPGVWRFFTPLGNESLAVLFVLSGFVIGYVSDSRETTLQSYLIHRAARVYSVLIHCVILGFLLDCVGRHIHPHYYAQGSWPPLHSNFVDALMSLFSLSFVGEAWNGNLFPGSMAPY